MKSFIIVLFFLALPFLNFAQNRYWVSGVTANWNTNSWSSSSTGLPDGGGAPSGVETALFTSSFTGNCNVDVNVNIQNINMRSGYTGTIDLLGFSFTLNGSATSLFEDGVISDTPGTSSVTLNSTGTIDFRGTNFNAKILGSAKTIIFSGGIFNDLVDVDNNSSGSGYGHGGCTFNANVKLTNSGTGYLLLGRTNPDIFNGDLELVNTSTSRIRPAYTSAGNQINGNLTVSNTGGGIYFGENGGAITLASSKTIGLGTNGFTQNDLRLINFTQTGATSQSLTLSGTARMYLDNASFDGDVSFISPRIDLRNSTFNGISNFEKSGTSSDSGTGNNTFMGACSIKNSGSGPFYFGNTNPDTFNNNVELLNTGSSTIYFANSSLGNTVGGNFTVTQNSVNNVSTYIANGTSSLSIAGNVTIINKGNSNNQSVYLADDGTLTIGGTLDIQNALLGSSATSQVYVAGTSSSSVSITGTTMVKNSGAGNSHRIFIGNSGDVTFNDDLTIDNNSSASNSSIYCNYGANSHNDYNGNITLMSTNASSDGVLFGQNGGSGTLANLKTVTIGGGGFIAGYLHFRNFTQIGNTIHNITLTNTARFENYDSDWGGNFTLVTPSFKTRGTRYRGVTDITQNGTVGNGSYGGNQFDMDVTLTNSGTNSLTMGVTLPDSLANDLVVNNSGSGRTYIANNSAGNFIGRDLIINNSGTGGNVSYVNVNSGTSSSSSIIRNCIVNNTGGANNVNVYLNSGGTSLSIGGDLNVTNNTSATSSTIYIGMSNTLTVDGNTTLVNSGTGDRAYIYVGYYNSSSVTFNGDVSVSNSGANTSRNISLGYQGYAVFNADLSIANSSSAINSQVACNQSANSSNQYNGNIKIETTDANCDGISFGRSGGTGVLAATKTISLSAGGFIAGELYFRNFTQTGNTAHNIVLDVSGTAKFENYDSNWGGDVIFSAPRMYSRGTAYAGTAMLTKTGGNSDYSVGGNVFQGDYTMNNSGTGYFLFGGSVSDDFQGNVTLNNTGTSRIHLAYNSAGNTIAGDLIANNTASGSSCEVSVCSSSNASITIGGNVNLNNGGNGNRNYIYLGYSGKVTSIGGNIIANNNSASSIANIYLSSSDTLNLVGNLTINNIGTSNSQTVLVADRLNSLVTIGGITEVVNSGANSLARVYLGSQGSMVFNGDLSIKNSSSASNSQIYLSYSSSSQNLYNENIIVENTDANGDGVIFGNGNGSGILAATKTITVGAGGFAGGQLYLRNFIQTGNTAHTLNLDAAGTAILYNYDSDWGGDVVFSAPRMYTRGTLYRRTAQLTKQLASNDYSAGGNTFNDDVILTNNGTGYFLMGNGNFDIFHGNVDLNNNGSSNLYIGNSSLGNQIDGDVTIINASTGNYGSVSISNNNNSSTTIAGNVTANNIGSANNAGIYIGNYGKIIQIGGNVDLTNNCTGNYSHISIANSDTVTVLGSLTARNIGTSNNEYLYLANGTNSKLTIGGVARIINSGSGSLSRTYTGNSGSVLFNDDLFVSNSSSANNSQMYFNNSSNSNNSYNGNIEVESYHANSDGIYFGASNGAGTLAATKTVTVGANGYSAGQLLFRNFTQVGNTAQTLNLDAAGTAYFYNYDSDWGGNAIFSAPRMVTRGTTYRGTAYLEKTNGASDASVGGNLFQQNAELKNTGSGYFLMGNGSPDIFQGNLIMNNLGTNNMYLAYNSSGNTIAGDFTINHATIGTSTTYTYISGNSSSTLSVGGNAVINNASSATNSYMNIGDNGDVEFLGDLTLNNTSVGINTSEIRMANSTNSTVNIRGNCIYNNTGTATYNRGYIYNSGNGVIDGTLDVINGSAGDRNYIYIGNGNSSYATFNDVVTLSNSGGNIQKEIYIGRSGDLTFNSTVNLTNRATATYSYCEFNQYSNSSSNYNENVTIEAYGTNCDGVRFGSGSGMGTLANAKTISIGANGFTDGLLLFKNFTQLGATPQLISTTSNSRMEYNNALWNGNVTFTSPRQHIRSSVFNGETFIEKTGGSSDASYGDNTYNSNVTFKNSGTGYFMPTSNNSSDHNGDVTYIKTGTGAMHITYSAPSTYAGNINFDFNSLVYFAGNTGRIVMDGITPQSINDLGASPQPVFRRLTTNNPNSEITLNTPIFVQTDLDLITGNVISDATNFITMYDNSTVTTVSDNAFVDGPLQKKGNDLFKFPVGKSGAYRPIEISNPSSTSAMFKAEFFDTDPHLSGYNHGAKDATLNHISNCEHWILDRTNSTNNVNVKLYYDSYGTSSCSGVDNQSELAVARWDGTMWKDHGNGGVGGTIANGWVTTSGAVTSFSPFTLASTTVNNPLPIELISFDAIKSGNKVDLLWETASEINNDYFTIERSSNGIDFEEVETIEGAGNSTQTISYKAIDESPLKGTSYYRLKQTDFNGDYTYSDFKQVTFTNKGELSIYPNPVKEVLNIGGILSTDEVLIYSIEGKEVYKGNANQVDASNFSNGVYQLVIKHKEGDIEVIKFVK